MANPLDDNIQFLKHVGPPRAEDFAKLDIHTVRDLIWTFPRDMADRSAVIPIAECREETLSTVLATALSVTDKTIRRNRRGRFGGGNGAKRRDLHITTAEFTDDSGKILEVTWFNQPWLKEKLPGRRVMLHGKVTRGLDRFHMEHPQHEIVPDDVAVASLNFGRIVPIYPCTGNLNQNIWRKAMAAALDSRLEYLEDPLPPDVVANKRFPGAAEAIRSMHFPESAEQWLAARRRLAWTESLLMQLAMLAARRHALHDFPGRAFNIGPELDRRIRRLFPFKLTPAQNRCVDEIVGDMRSPLPMHRLLQGDVGSGKTAVATYALLAAVANRTQVCIMAPTSLLARQHYDTFKRFLENSPHHRVGMSLLVGGMTAAEKELILGRMANGTLDIVVATHAATGGGVAFRDLGLVVIDEQHKFGVNQRLDLARKGVRPDVLIMSATPIPRSLAMSVYGDLAVSVIDQLPPGRKAVKTLLQSQGSPGGAWKLVRDELKRGRQAFVVCPLVEENEEIDLKSAGEAMDELQQGELKGYRLELLHGRMSRKDQLAVMDRFRSGGVDVLVSTIVVEVGVDVPNATVMVVEHADRFGLAQLHQLRGRVGRGAEQGTFVMLSDAKGGDAGERLSALLDSTDGFAIAEADLRIRGPGDFTGVRQHGLTGLKLLDLVRDLDLIADSRLVAQDILAADPQLSDKVHIHLRHELVRCYGKQWDRSAMG